ncbi:hypothetical protein ACM26M_02785 [Kluyvera cryocrescens]|uniref:hypothetical protein n=1 Tax=Kluyvera cryocrescens TaxID=580 RepID=UPI0039F661F3
MLNLQASKISNVVTFTVDKAAMAKAKAAIKEVEAFGNKTKDPQTRFEKVKRNQKKAQALADQAMLDKAAARSQKAQQKQALRDAKQLAAREEKADIKRRSANLQVGGIKGKYGLDPAKEYETIKFIKEQTEQYRKGLISSQRMNYEIRERIALIRREAALQARLTAEQQAALLAAKKANKGNYAGVAGKMKGGVNMIGGTGALMAGGAALMAGAGVLRNVKNTGDENLDLLRKSKLVDMNPNAVKAMTTWGIEHGVDSASTDKITDNMKDVRERLGESTANSKRDAKTGKYTGGNGAVDNIMNQFGWNKDQIKGFENRPLDFVQATVNEGQRRGMSDAQIGHLIEDLGDDMMHYTDMFKDNGKGFITVLERLKASGQTLNDEQWAQVEAFGNLEVKVKALGDGMSVNMFSGFMEGFGNSAEDLSKNAEILNVAAHTIGEEFGSLAKEVTNLIDSFGTVRSWLTEKFPSVFGDNKTPGMENSSWLDNMSLSMGNNTASFIESLTGWNPQSVGRSLGYNQPGTDNSIASGAGAISSGAAQYNPVADLRNSALAIPTANSPVYNMNPVFNLTPSITAPVTIQSDTSNLREFISFEAKASQQAFMQGLTLSLSAGGMPN